MSRDAWKLQLVGRKEQDLLLTGNPEITYFHSVYKRHTPFVIEQRYCNFNGILKFGQKISCRIRRYGDLLKHIFLYVTLPELQTDDNSSVSWVNGIGNFMIDSATLRIGGIEVETIYGQYLDISNQYHIKDREANYHQMVGKSNVFTSSSHKALILYVPLSFSFTKCIAHALPLISIYEQEVYIDIKLKSAELLYTIEGGGNLTTNPEIDQIELLCEYIYLDRAEREFFAQDQNYLIEQVQIYNLSIDTSKRTNIIDLSEFSHPIKELYWVIQGIEVQRRNQWENYSDDVQTLTNIPRAPIRSILLRYEGMERFETLEEEYFRVVQPYTYHTDSIQNYIYSYSFSLHPEDRNPKGEANLSSIDFPTLEIVLRDDIQESYITVYAVNYNWLQILAGRCGVMFAN